MPGSHTRERQVSIYLSWVVGHSPSAGLDRRSGHTGLRGEVVPKGSWEKLEALALSNHHTDLGATVIPLSVLSRLCKARCQEKPDPAASGAVHPF